jgi:hypothetical protein
MTEDQIARKSALMAAGLTIADVARKISDDDPMNPVSRQAVSAEILDTDPYGSDRIRRGIVKALKGTAGEATLAQLFPEHYT